MRSFEVVDAFERRVAQFAGARYAVATMTGTAAIFLCCRALRVGEVTLPARTFISVPMAVIQAGGSVRFEDRAWRGTYLLDPTTIVDGALRFRRGMYEGGLHCLSFHARKILNIGEGGMVLTDDPDMAATLRRMRYSGRDAAHGYAIEKVREIGWQLYMTPEKAARGLHLMEYIGEGLPDQEVDYPDLRLAPVFQGASCST